MGPPSILRQPSMARQPKQKAGCNEGARAATQIVFYAGKRQLMTQTNLRKIGVSSNYHELFLDVCQEEPAKMRALMQRAKERCAAGENESKRDKKRRRAEKKVYIAKKKRKSSKKNASAHANGGTSENGSEDENEEREDDLESETDMEEIHDSVEGPDLDNDMKPELTPEDFNSMAEYRYHRELRLIQGHLPRADVDYFNQVLLAQYPTVNMYTAIQKVLSTCVKKLDAEFLRDQIVDFLLNRGKSASTIKPPIVSATSSPEEILEALHGLSRLAGDVAIRRVYALIMLYQAVLRRTSPSRSHHDILRAIAEKNVGSGCEKEINKVADAYKRDYRGGQMWEDVIEMFGGPGIVIVFVVAEVGAVWVAHKWTDVDRAILAKFAQHLLATRKLVASFEDNVLDTYCRHGYLAKEVIDQVETVDIFDV